MDGICTSCGCEGTLVTGESGTACTACGATVTLPAFETDPQGDRQPKRRVSQTAVFVI